METNHWESWHFAAGQRFGKETREISRKAGDRVQGACVDEWFGEEEVLRLRRRGKEEKGFGGLHSDLKNTRFKEECVFSSDEDAQTRIWGG